MTAFLETPVATRRRRAFFAAFNQRFGRDAALEAINLWEQTYGSDQPLMRGIAQFAAIAVKELSLPVAASEVSMLLLQYLQVDESVLPPDPLPILIGRTAAPASQASNTRSEPVSARVASPADLSDRDPINKTLSALLVKLCDMAGQADARSQGALVKTFVMSCLDAMSRDVARDAASLLQGKTQTLSLDYTPQLATTMINLLYVPLAELYGPVTAGRIMTSAVRAVEDMPEARGFAPRDLL